MTGRGRLLNAVCTAFALCTLGPVHRALADDKSPAASIVITLKDGTVVRGDLVDTKPGSKVTVRLENGEVRVFAQAEVVHTEAAPTRPLRLTLPGLASLTPEGSGLGESGVLVHIDTNKPGETYLYRRVPGGWAEVCMAPCDQPFDTALEYRIGGMTIAESSPFRLNGAGSTTLHVDASSFITGTLGWINFGIGLAMTIPATYLLTRPSSPDQVGPDDNHLPGWILLGNGIPWLIVGTIMLAESGTSVTTDCPGTCTTSSTQPPSIAVAGPVRWGASGFTFLASPNTPLHSLVAASSQFAGGTIIFASRCTAVCARSRPVRDAPEPKVI